ncbi:MAG: GNAT family N-acetyltransferase [Angustibacter sp.]
MAPSQVAVRLVDASDSVDIGVIADLWASSRDHPRASVRKDVSHCLGDALTRDEVVAFVARLDEQDVGFLVLSCGPLLPLMGDPAVSIEHLFVVPDVRRKGVGRALLARAASYAEHQGVGQVCTSVPASGRQGQRFFARLGFSPFVVRRVVATATLRRRLMPGFSPAQDATVRRRRSLRARSRAVALRARSGI